MLCAGAQVHRYCRSPIALRRLCEACPAFLLHPSPSRCADSWFNLYAALPLLILPVILASQVILA